jgi:hypothetical protein
VPDSKSLSVGFVPDPDRLEKQRAEIAALPDLEIVKRGRLLRGWLGDDVSERETRNVVVLQWAREYRLLREEWRRRHPSPK